ncbi:MAG: bifunctional 3,4-dihydroxy-2-butanone-4-phosphate synthase/GTP cyclohydrolase II [bacterium]|nr:bifunctional 3,4-dihydroxy-2-butanone-4-phosphate synthase/GTP cyclohydrolase II [bacterium]
MKKNRFKFNLIQEAVDDIAAGKMVVVVDDEDRENEGDLVMAASHVTPDTVNFMIRYGRGLVCVPVTDEIIKRMQLKEMVKHNQDNYKTAFTVSIDAAGFHGVTTGISAADRARTIRLFVDPSSTPSDIVTPGHIFPLRARKMGVLRRAGHTEAAVDLARLAGTEPAGVICEIIKEDGEMARVADLIVFAREHNLKIITIKDLISYRIKKESFIAKVSTANMPTEFGEFQIVCYEDILNKAQHIALVKGDIVKSENIYVRIHSECLTGDVFHSQRCDCGYQLQESMKMIEEQGSGVILYMRQEGRGIGLSNKIKAYSLQDKGSDTVEANIELGFDADLRDYGVGAQMLLDLGVKSLNLITNNPKKIIGLEGYGISINKRIPVIISPNIHNEKYLKTKSEKLGHIL